MLARRSASFHDPGLGVRPVEDGDVPVVDALAAQAAHELGDEARFFVLVPGPVDGRLVALAVLRPEALVLPGLVVGDDVGGDLEDALGRAIVLLERDHPAIRVVLLEVEDVPEVSTSPPVHRLVGVADDAEVPVLLGQHLDDTVLRPVRVLVLVDQDVAPDRAVPVERLGNRLEQPDDAEQEVVEIDAARRVQDALRRGGRARRCAPRAASARAAPRPRRTASGSSRG
jgi:hypothetical protein